MPHESCQPARGVAQRRSRRHSVFIASAGLAGARPVTWRALRRCATRPWAPRPRSQRHPPRPSKQVTPAPRRAVGQEGCVALRRATADQRVAGTIGSHLLDMAHACVLRCHPRAPLPGPRLLAWRIEVRAQHRQHLAYPVESQTAQSARIQADQRLPRKTAEAREPGLRHPQCLAPLANGGAQVEEVHGLNAQSVAG